VYDGCLAHRFNYPTERYKTVLATDEATNFGKATPNGEADISNFKP
jgi:hypothetical protein